MSHKKTSRFSIYTKQIVNTLRRNPKFVGILILAGIGTAVLVATKAGTFSIALQPELGSTSGCAEKITDNSATEPSSNNAVRFGTGSGCVVVPPPPSDNNKFTFAVVPDTQNEIGYTGNYYNFTNRWNWLINNRQSLNLKYIFQVGDVNNWAGKICETATGDPNCSGITNYDQSSEGLKILENAGMPYLITPGNHDTAAVRADGNACQDTKPNPSNGIAYKPSCPGSSASVQVRNMSSWEKTFPKSRYPGIVTLCDEFNANRDRLMTKGAPAGMSSSSIDHPQWMSNYCASHNNTDNAYRTFTAGGLNWLAINYEFYPRQVVQEWMRIVIENHPHHNIILVSHMFLSSNSKTLSTGSSGYTAVEGTPKRVFDYVISKYPNVKFTFSGHTTGNNGCAKLTGVNGNTIYSYLNDRQDGLGNVVRLLEITPDAGNGKGKVDSRMYSPKNEKNNYPTQLDMSDFKNCSTTDIQWTR